MLLMRTYCGGSVSVAVGASVGVSEGVRVSVAGTSAAGSSVGAVVFVGTGIVAVTVEVGAPRPCNIALPRTIPKDRQAITTIPAPNSHNRSRLGDCLFAGKLPMPAEVRTGTGCDPVEGADVEAVSGR